MCQERAQAVCQAELASNSLWTCPHQQVIILTLGWAFLVLESPQYSAEIVAALSLCAFFPRLASDSQRRQWPGEDFKLLPLIWGLCPNPARAPFFASSSLAHLWPHPHSLFLPLILHHLAHTLVSEPDPTPVAAPTHGSGATHSRFGW